MEVGLDWLRSHWQWGTLNLFAGSVLVYVLSQGSTSWTNMHTFDTGLENGKWAIRFLLTVLTMTPLNTYFGWRDGIKLRKSAGLWAFGFAFLHIVLYVHETKLEGLTIPMPDFLVLGIVGMGILSLLAATSNRWSMKWLGKKWKQLHRRVYLAGIAVVAHSILATGMSKKLMVRDPESMSELKVYAAVLCVLLVVRIPIVRELIMQIPMVLQRLVKIVRLATTSDNAMDPVPKIYAREPNDTVGPTFIIPNTISNDIHGPAEKDLDGPSAENQLEEKVEIVP